MISGEHLKTMTINFYLYNLSSFSSNLEKYDADIPKAVLIILPIVFSKAGRSVALLDLLDAGSFSIDPQLPRRFPQEEWRQLFSSSYTACKLALAAKVDNRIPVLPMILEPGTEIGTSSRPSGLNKVSRRIKGLLKSFKS
jgi:hypothetical protein